MYKRQLPLASSFIVTNVNVTATKEGPRYFLTLTGTTTNRFNSDTLVSTPLTTISFKTYASQTDTAKLLIDGVGLPVDIIN